MTTTSKPASVSPCARLGVISPDGSFYPCAIGCHDALCMAICASEELGARLQLENAGWLFLMGSGIAAPRNVSAAAISRLGQVIMEMRIHQPDLAALDSNPENYRQQNCSSSVSAEEIVEMWTLFYRRHNGLSTKLVLGEISKRIGSHPGD